MGRHMGEPLKFKYHSTISCGTDVGSYQRVHWIRKINDFYGITKLKVLDYDF